MSPIAVSNWNVTTINGVQFLVVDVASFRIPLDWDPSSNMFIAVAAPSGGLGNIPALLKGDPGTNAGISDTINFTALAATDTTPDSASFTQIATDVWQLNLALHQGPKGDPGPIEFLSATDVTGTAIPGQTLVVNPTATGLEFASQRVGDRYVPAAIRSTPSGNPAYTLATVPIPAQPWDWRPEVRGQAIVTSGLDVGVDLIARLSNGNPDGGETTGNEVGRAIGVPGIYANFTQVLAAGPPPGSNDNWDRVPAGQQATIFFRAERQSGFDTFTTAATTSRFSVKVAPCPAEVAAPTFFPQTNVFTAGATYTIQSWDKYVDLVAVGGGGGGNGETGLGNGPGGVGGLWAAQTLVVGTDIAIGGTITVTVGAGGAGGPYITPGVTGTASTFSWTNPTSGAQTLTAAGGLGGSALTNLTSWGLSPGNETFAGVVYIGGALNAIGGVGNGPGGGGAGGAAFEFGFAGAPGQAWIVDRWA